MTKLKQLVISKEHLIRSLFLELPEQCFAFHIIKGLRTCILQYIVDKFIITVHKLIGIISNVHLCRSAPLERNAGITTNGLEP